MPRRDFENRDPASLRRFLDEGVILVAGETEGVQLSDPAPVYASIVVDVTGYGPHQGAIYAYQNRFHGHSDAALQEAFEILEDWVREHYHKDADPDDESVTETFDALGWKLSAADFAQAIEGTDAAKFIEIDE